jgi:hypothetical protein
MKSKVVRCPECKSPFYRHGTTLHYWACRSTPANADPLCDDCRSRFVDAKGRVMHLFGCNSVSELVVAEFDEESKQ